MRAPKPPQIKPLPILDLPPANRVADDGSIMTLGDAGESEIAVEASRSVGSGPLPVYLRRRQSSHPDLESRQLRQLLETAGGHHHDRQRNAKNIHRNVDQSRALDSR